MNLVQCVFIFMCLSQSQASIRRPMEGFVVGGDHTTIANYPHSALLSAFCGSDWICGGAILNQRIVITAGHCVYGCYVTKGHHIEVFLGSSSILKVKIMRMVSRIVVHKKYVEKTVENDIALAMLDKSIPLGRNTKRVIISRSFPNTISANVAGWGIVDVDTGDYSVLLKQVSQRIRSKKTCALVGALHSGMFCAGSTDFYEDRPAQGDSGSALITDSYTEIGLVSFHIEPYPALMVYTNISYYFKWIVLNAKEMYCAR